MILVCKNWEVFLLLVFCAFLWRHGWMRLFDCETDIWQLWHSMKSKSSCGQATMPAYRSLAWSFLFYIIYKAQRKVSALVSSLDIVASQVKLREALVLAINSSTSTNMAHSITLQAKKLSRHSPLLSLRLELNWETGKRNTCWLSACRLNKYDWGWRRKLLCQV